MSGNKALYYYAEILNKTDSHVTVKCPFCGDTFTAPRAVCDVYSRRCAAYCNSIFLIDETIHAFDPKNLHP